MTVQVVSNPDLEGSLNERNDLDDKKIYLKEIEKLREEKANLLEELGEYAACPPTIEEIKSVISTGFNAIELINEAQRVVDNQTSTQNAKINEYVLCLKNMEKKLENEKRDYLGEIEEANLAIKRLKNGFLHLKEEKVHTKAVSRILTSLNGRRTGFKAMSLLGLDLTPIQKLMFVMVVFFATVVVGVVVGVTLVNFR